MPTSNGNGNVHARHLNQTTDPYARHALIGCQHCTSGMEKNKDTATHRQAPLGDTAAAATQTPATANEVRMSLSRPPTPAAAHTSTLPFVSQHQEGGEEEDPVNEEAGKEKYQNTHKDTSEAGKNARQGGGQTNGEQRRG